MCVNVLLVALKLWGARLSSSMAMKADALHSSSDILVSLLIIFGVLIASRNSRWLNAVENAIALTISALIMGAAAGLLIKVVRGESYLPLQRIPVALGIIWLCILISYFVAKYKIRVGRESGSPSLVADGYHSKMDTYSSVAVFIGISGHMIGFQIDTLASIVVIILVFKVGIEVMVASINGLARSQIFVFQSVSGLKNTAVGRKLTAVHEQLFASKLNRLVEPMRQCGSVLWSNRRKLSICIVALAILVYICSGFYQIQPDEVGVVLRCGKLVDDRVPPGLHYHFPKPISKLCRVKAQSVCQLDFGFRTIARRGEVREPDAYLWESMHNTGIYQKVVPEAIMLTGDTNEVDVNFTVECRVAEGSAAGFLFNIAESEEVFRALTESAVRSIVGQMPLDDILTTARPELERRVFERLQQLLDEHETCISLVAVRLQDVHPPVEIVPAFRDVATAREQRETAINEAGGYRNDLIPKAKGAARQETADAQAYLTEKELQATGDAAYFAAVLDSFRAEPAVIKFEMNTKCLEETLPAVRKVIISEKVGRQTGGVDLQKMFLMGEFLRQGDFAWESASGGGQMPEAATMVSQPVFWSEDN